MVAWSSFADPAMAPEIEYLVLYRRMLVHQQQHRSSLTMLTSLSGVEQPWETCLACLVRHRADENHGIKRRFAWAVPDENALKTIARYSPSGVVEIGAGGGYWAMLLRERGVDVVAYDPDPQGGSDAPWHTGRRWSEVLQGDHTAVIGHPDRTLLLCWPSYSEAWTHEAVELYGGDTVIYIGEGNGGCTGDDRMHVLLGAEPYCSHWSEPCTCDWPKPQFREVESVAIPQWWGLHDYLSVYTRI